MIKVGDFILVKPCIPMEMRLKDRDFIDDSLLKTLSLGGPYEVQTASKGEKYIGVNIPSKPFELNPYMFRYEEVILSRECPSLCEEAEWE